MIVIDLKKGKKEKQESISSESFVGLQGEELLSSSLRKEMVQLSPLGGEQKNTATVQV